MNVERPFKFFLNKGLVADGTPVPVWACHLCLLPSIVLPDTNGTAIAIFGRLLQYLSLESIHEAKESKPGDLCGA